MASGTITSLPHGLVVSQFLGVAVMSNGRVLLWTDTDLYEMPDTQSAAVSVATPTNPMTSVFGICQDEDGLDRVMISCGTDQVVVCRYSVGDSLSVAEETIDPVFTANGVTLMTGGNNTIICVGPDGAMKTDYNTGGSESAATFGLYAAFDASIELLGDALVINAWPGSAGEPDYDLSDFGYFEENFGQYELETLSPVVQILCGWRAPGGTRIFGGTGGQVKTDSGGDDNVNGAVADVTAVGYDEVNSLYEALDADGDFWRSSDGSTWSANTITGAPTGAGKNQVFFGRTNTRLFLVDRIQASDSPELVPNFDWWFSTDGSSWTQKANTDGVIGFTNNGGGSDEVVRLDTATGDLYWSSDQGDAFTGPVAGLIPQTAARRIRHIQETPAGMVAWGNDVLYTQVFAGLHTDAWQDEEWPGGDITAVRVLDDGTLRVHKRVAGGVDQHETWLKGPGEHDVWTRTYVFYTDLTPILTGIVAASIGRNHSFFLGEYAGGGPNVAVTIGRFNDSYFSTGTPGWVGGITPSFVVATNGTYPRVALLDTEFPSKTMAIRAALFTPATPSDGWQVGDLLTSNDEASGQALWAASYNDVFLAGDASSRLYASADGLVWEHILTGSDLIAGINAVE